MIIKIAWEHWFQMFSREGL